MTGSVSPPSGGRQLSDEQQAIVQCQADALRVVAFAGSGKTTTLRAYAQARPTQRMLYLAFNRSVAQEAQGTFGAHVCCSTRSMGWPTGRLGTATATSCGGR